MKSCVQCGEHFPDDKNFCANSGKMLVNSKYSVFIVSKLLIFMQKNIIIACGIGKINT